MKYIFLLALSILTIMSCVDPNAMSQEFTTTNEPIVEEVIEENIPPPEENIPEPPKPSRPIDTTDTTPNRSEYENIVVDNEGIDKVTSYENTDFIVINSVKCYDVESIQSQLVKELQKGDNKFKDPLLTRQMQVVYWAEYAALADTGPNTLDIDAAKQAYAQMRKWYANKVLHLYIKHCIQYNDIINKEVAEIYDKYARKVHNDWKIHLRYDDTNKQKIWSLVKRNGNGYF